MKPKHLIKKERHFGFHSILSLILAIIMVVSLPMASFADGIVADEDPEVQLLVSP